MDSWIINSPQWEISEIEKILLVSNVTSFVINNVLSLEEMTKSLKNIAL